MSDSVERLRRASVYEEYKAILSGLGDEAADEIERLRAIRDELAEALDVLLRYVDEEAEDGMMQCVETQMARDALARARGEQT
jgi:hypothetical protein